MTTNNTKWAVKLKVIEEWVQTYVVNFELPEEATEADASLIAKEKLEVGFGSAEGEGEYVRMHRDDETRWVVAEVHKRE